MQDNDLKELDRLSMLSSPKMGRPKKWTEEAIRKMADELEEYASKKSTITLNSFATSRRFNPEILSRLADLSPYFSESLRNAKIIIGERREQLAYLKKGSEKIFIKTQRMYDPDWQKCQNDTLQEEELIKARAKIKALEEQVKLEKENGNDGVIAMLRESIQGK